MIAARSQDSPTTGINHIRRKTSVKLHQTSRRLTADLITDDILIGADQLLEIQLRPVTLVNTLNRAEPEQLGELFWVSLRKSGGEFGKVRTCRSPRRIPVPGATTQAL